MSAPADTYLSNDVYQKLKTTLAKLAAEPFDREGTDPETEVVTALGEIGGVWPEFVKDGFERIAE